jgi:uncharacterized protein YdhG (YjbR/CyaY superfamily)
MTCNVIRITCAVYVRGGEATAVQNIRTTMTKTVFKSVEEYMAAQPAALRSLLERVRSAIRHAMPEAEEAISYNIPAYTLHATPVLYFAGWRRHYSLYPATKRIVSALKGELAPYEISKGTIRFPLPGPVPVKLIGRIAKLRAQEVGARKKPKKAAPKGR